MGLIWIRWKMSNDRGTRAVLAVSHLSPNGFVKPANACRSPKILSGPE